MADRQTKIKGDMSINQENHNMFKKTAGGSKSDEAWFLEINIPPGQKSGCSVTAKGDFEISAGVEFQSTAGTERIAGLSFGAGLFKYDCLYLDSMGHVFRIQFKGGNTVLSELSTSGATVQVTTRRGTWGKR
jgi:hypothetical protein